MALFVMPVLLGGGISLFGPVWSGMSLWLKETMRYASGVIKLVYVRLYGAPSFYFDPTRVSARCLLLILTPLTLKDVTMANDYGRLPKADLNQLEPDMQHRLKVWYDKAYPDDNLFLTLARRPAVLEMFLGWVSFVYAGRSNLDPKLVELCRIRLAARNQCVH
jgi:hypothetical protein